MYDFVEGVFFVGLLVDFQCTSGGQSMASLRMGVLEAQDDVIVGVV